MSVVVNASSRTGGGEPSQGVLRFAPVNALRWQRGKAQRNWPPSLLLGVAINALAALALMALVVWLAFQFGLGLKGLNLAQLWAK